MQASNGPHQTGEPPLSGKIQRYHSALRGPQLEILFFRIVLADHEFIGAFENEATGAEAGTVVAV